MQYKQDEYNTTATSLTTGMTQRDRERAEWQEKNKWKNSRKLIQRIGCKEFTAIPQTFLNSDALMNLSGAGCKLLWEFVYQVNGKNNGDLQATWRILKDRGWKSKDTVYRALKELREAGIITQTRQGGRHKCSLYALTFIAIDECLNKDGISKHDADASKVPSNLWHENRKHLRDKIEKKSDKKESDQSQ